VLMVQPRRKFDLLHFLMGRDGQSQQPLHGALFVVGRIEEVDPHRFGIEDRRGFFSLDEQTGLAGERSEHGLRPCCEVGGTLIQAYSRGRAGSGSSPMEHWCAGRKGCSTVSPLRAIGSGINERGAGAAMSEPAGAHQWVAVDWGTSNVRAWGIGAGGEIVWSRSSDRGMGRLSAADYPAVLTELLAAAATERPAPVEVLICGMAGARQGWREAPYLEAPAALDRLLLSAVRPETDGTPFDVRILPGSCQKTPGGEDVMRGEETQLLGLLALRPEFSGTVCMPGTHSKWVQLEGGRVVGFATAMTG